MIHVHTLSDMDVHYEGSERSPTLPRRERGCQRNGRGLPLMGNYDAVLRVRLAGGGGRIGSENGGIPGISPALKPGTHVVDLLVAELIESLVRILRNRAGFGRAVHDDALIARRKQPPRPNLHVGHVDRARNVLSRI